MNKPDPIGQLAHAMTAVPASEFRNRMRDAVKSLMDPLKQRDLAHLMHVSEARMSQLLRADNWTVNTIQQLLVARAKILRQQNGGPAEPGMEKSDD